jgi:uncharacterized phage protein (TIGR01671 family)
MKREIKFRAWDGEKMRYPNMISFSDNGGDSSTCYTIDELEPEYFHAEVMQYTGLKDKNGKEIYEGDIVKAASEELDDCLIPTGDFYDEDIQKVYWDDEAAGWFLTENRYKQVQPMAHRQKFEVIGNIYETPSLLTNQVK